MATIVTRTSKTGQPSFVVRVRVKGQPEHSQTFRRKTDAHRWAQATESALRDGRYVHSTEARRHTVADLIDRYVAEVLPGKKDQRNPRRQLDWWKARLGRRRLVDVTPALLIQVRDEIAREPTRDSIQHSPASVVRYLAALSHAFTVAVREWQWLEYNPFLRVSRPKEPKGSEHHAEREQAMTQSHLFDGLKVLEIASYIAAPAAATMLADFGADVVKIEPPEGDPYRAMSTVPGMPISEHNYAWILTNRNKRSLALDLKAPEGQKVLQRIIPAVDVLITNFPADVRPRLGLAYEQLAPLSRRLIYASLTGYGETGPEASRPGYDSNAWWARSGLMDLARAEAGSMPVRSLPGMGDHPTAAALYGAIVTALYQRERTGQGAHVGTSLMANGAWANGVFIQAALCGATFQDRKPRHAALNALGNIYQCRDGRWFILSLLHEEKMWPVLVAKLGSPELTADPRFATRAERRTHAQALVHELDRIFAGRDAAEWHRIFEAAGLTAGVVQRVTDVPQDRQMVLNKVLVRANSSSDGHMTVNSPVWIGQQEKVPPQQAPEVGEHTDSILLEFGFSTGEIERLRTAGVIVSPG